MTACDVCTKAAVMLVSCSQANGGGDSAYGSFRSYRCEDHGREAVDQLQRHGFTKIQVDRFPDPAPVTEHDAAILVEQQLHETRALLEASAPLDQPGQSVSFFATLMKFRAITACRRCGKSQAVLNSARRGFKPESITPETHCFCPGSPILAARDAGALNPLELAGSGRES